MDKSESRATQGYEYVLGEAQPSCFECIQTAVGGVAGCLKSFCPCCFFWCCCCNQAYTTIPQGTKGLLMHYGRFKKVLGPGIVYLNALTESCIEIDCRIKATLIPPQNLLTKDSINIIVESVAYYRIDSPQLTYFRLQDTDSWVVNMASNIIKNTIGGYTFQELLDKRESIALTIREQLKLSSRPWGLHIDQLYLKDFKISKDLERELVSAPIARRNAEAKILSAKGDVEIARMLANKSKILDTPTAIQVRYLETLKQLASKPGSQIVYKSQV